MDVRRHRLDNGLRIAVVPIPGLLSAAVLLAIEAGQWFEPAGRPGIGRLTAQAMLRGTTTRDAKTWADALDAIGAAARLDVGSHAATFSAQSLGGDLDALLDLMADAVVRPAFAEKEVELVDSRRSRRSKTTRRTRAPSPRARGASSSIRTAIPFARARSGTSRSCAARRPTIFGSITAAPSDRTARSWSSRAASMRSRLRRRRQGVLLVACGRRSRGAEGPGGAPDDRGPKLAIVPDKTQSDVVLGWPGMPSTDPRFVAARVTNMVFAADTFASRAGHVVRDELGLAYYVFSTIGGSAASRRGSFAWA